MSSTSPRIYRISADSAIETPGPVACPHCGGRVDLIRTETARPPVALVVMTEPGPRTAAEMAVARAMVGGLLRRLLEVIGGRRPIGQLGDGVDPAVLRYVRACRTGTGPAWVLRSVRVCFPVEDAVEVAAVVGSSTRVRAVAVGEVVPIRVVQSDGQLQFYVRDRLVAQGPHDDAPLRTFHIDLYGADREEWRITVDSLLVSR